jgi:hypothetical protein
MSLTMVSSNVAGYTKKQVTGALLFTGYCVGNIIGPQTFRDSEAPGYHSAYIAYVKRLFFRGFLLMCSTGCLPVIRSN